MNHTPNHLNYNHPQPSSSTSGDQNQPNQQNYHQLASPITFEDDMLQMQTTSRPMHQFFCGGNMYDTMFFPYPAPSPPAPAQGPSLLNAQEFSTINGFLETITEGGFDQTVTTKYPQLDSLGWLAEEEPQFPQMPMGQQQHLQSYMGNALAGNNINTLDSSSTPSIHSNAVQSNSIPSTPSQLHHDSPVIVNPFTGHGLIPQPNPIHIPSDGVVSNSLAWGSDPSFDNSRFHAALQPPTQQDLQRKVLAIMVPNSSGGTTANSPVEIKFERNGEDITGSDTGSNFTAGNTQSPTLSATQTAGIKRRAEDEVDDLQGQPRKSRPRKDSSTEVIPKGKRGGKREHLSEAEKRQNHIQSEQKRRNQIKFGFDTLTELVPELRGGGYSKSAVLQHAAVYVENLVGGNITLRNILKNLEEKRNSGLSSGPDDSGHL
ncbi:hypothetical protein EV426DRAFT_700727 [Tirmania nivea]|nr:hypothetical protein EV426DRAFT_700727 [Tirmania nivea]